MPKESKLTKCRRYIKRFGVKKLLLKTIFTVFSPVVKYFGTILLEKNLNNDVPEITSKITLSVDLAEIEELSKVQKINPTLTDAELQNCLKNGEKCFVVKHKEKIFGCVWVVSGEKTVSIDGNRKIDIKRNEAYIHGAYVHPDYRGLNAFPYLEKNVFIHLKNSGYGKVYTIVYGENYPSIRACEKAGFVQKEHAHYFYIPLFRKTFYRTKNLMTKGMAIEN